MKGFTELSFLLEKPGEPLEGLGLRRRAAQLSTLLWLRNRARCLVSPCSTLGKSGCLGSGCSVRHQQWALPGLYREGMPPAAGSSGAEVVRARCSLKINGKVRKWGNKQAGKEPGALRFLSRTKCSSRRCYCFRFSTRAAHPLRSPLCGADSSAPRAGTRPSAPRRPARGSAAPPGRGRPELPEPRNPFRSRAGPGGAGRRRAWLALITFGIRGRCFPQPSG